MNTMIVEGLRVLGEAPNNFITQYAAQRIEDLESENNKLISVINEMNHDFQRLADIYGGEALDTANIVEHKLQERGILEGQQCQLK
jgi:hypothetical protein